jgi:hypothetical protein
MINENEMLYCLIAFILGWLVSRHMSVGNGLVVLDNNCSKELALQAAAESNFLAKMEDANNAEIAKRRAEAAVRLCQQEGGGRRPVVPGAP